MEVDLSIFGSPGRTSAEDERDLSKSWPSGSAESGTSDLWQSRQKCGSGTSDLVLAELKYGKWNFRSLAITTERNCGSKASDL